MSYDYGRKSTLKKHYNIFGNKYYVSKNNYLTLQSTSVRSNLQSNSYTIAMHACKRKGGSVTLLTTSSASMKYNIHHHGHPCPAESCPPLKHHTSATRDDDDEERTAHKMFKKCLVMVNSCNLFVHRYVLKIEVTC